jgi:hypothetical protein
VRSDTRHHHRRTVVAMFADDTGPSIIIHRQAENSVPDGPEGRGVQARDAVNSGSSGSSSGSSGAGPGSGLGPGPGARPDRRPVTVGRMLPGPVLRRRAVRQPEGPEGPEGPEDIAYRWPPGDCSYAELDLRARAVAARLGAGLRPGARVLLAYPLGTDFAGAFYGCLYAGMIAVPLVLGSGGRDVEGTLAGAVRELQPSAVLTGGDAWTALAVDRSRTQVVEADGARVGGEPVRRLAESWAPVGVLRNASACQRYIADGLGGGRLEPALSHGDLTGIVAELDCAQRLGTAEDSLGWIASVYGLEDAVWRVLLPVQRSGL